MKIKKQNSTIYEFKNGFYVEVTEDDQDAKYTAFWISHKRYGTKLFMIGHLIDEKDVPEFILWHAWNWQMQYIEQVIKDDYFIEED